MVLGLIVVAFAAGSSPDDVASRYLTGIAAQGAASHAAADVLTSADIQAALDVEGNKQLAGCDGTSSCLAEIAAALDADVVIHGSLLHVGNGLTLQLAAYDVKNASSAGRRTLSASTLEKLAPQVERSAAELIEPRATKIEAGAKIRVLVLDIDSRFAAPKLQEEPGRPISPLGIAGIAGTTLGLVGIGVAGWFVYVADDANVRISSASQTPAKQKELQTTVYSSLWTAAGLGAAGVVVAGAGVTALLLDAGVE